MKTHQQKTMADFHADVEARQNLKKEADGLLGFLRRLADEQQVRADEMDIKYVASWIRRAKQVL